MSGHQGDKRVPAKKERFSVGNATAYFFIKPIKEYSMYYGNKKRQLPGFALKRSACAVSAVLLSTLGATNTLAQQESTELEEVLITGTLIRGTEVTGSQTI